MTPGSLPQNIQHNRQISQLEWKPIPKKRKQRLATIIICLLTATGIIVYGFYNNTELKYELVEDVSAAKILAIKNGTLKIYTCHEKHSYPVLFNLGLGLLAIILGTFVDRLSLVLEEMCQLQSRYNGKILVVFKACFSGISWPGIIVIVVLGSISLAIGKKMTFELGNLIYILGGIGVGPLITHFLNLNTLSEVDISRLVEEKHLYPAYTVAWDYYFHYLKKVLPKFNESFTESSVPEQIQTVQQKVPLSLKKMILLISHDCKTKDNLYELDNHIRKIDDKIIDGYKFPVYGLTSKEREYKLVILFAKEPLETLKEMSKSERIKTIHEDDCEEQVKLLYRTLASEILTSPINEECNDMCVLVPIMAENATSLQNGGLVKLIIAKIKADECPDKPQKQEGFMKASVPPGRTVQRQQTREILKSHTTTRDKGMCQYKIL